ncbi:MAG: SpoIIE family protein phosphatase [Clostridia bacterium]|nr:SpoIIE family protein phosphatase [Clostridia bacterium]
MDNVKKQKKRRITISYSFLRWLLLIVVVGFLASMAFTWIHQTKMSNDSAAELLRINVWDVRQDVIDASNENLLKLTRSIAAQLDGGVSPNSEELIRLMREYDVAEINIINENGIITATTMGKFRDYDMHSGAQSAEFLTLLDGSENEHVQNYQPTSFDPSLYRKYAAVTLRSGGFVQVGYDGERFQKDIDQNVISAAKNRHVGQTGSIIIANEEWNIVSDRYGLAGSNLSETGIWIDRDTMPEDEVFHSQVYGEDCSVVYIFSEGYYIVAVLPENEIILERNSSMSVMAIMEIILFLVLFTVIFLLVKYLVLDNLGKVNSSLSKITKGDLNEEVDVRSNAEFSDLSDDINLTVTTLKQYIAAAAARIDEELAFAKNIQESALPSVFPPYPDRTEFSLYAKMRTAKEVGGDFYDFYLLDDNKLAFLIADVSGKGIPAAMFMMTAKTVLRDYAERGDEPHDVFTNANTKLCDGNDAEMFLTAWMGFLETDTGVLHFVNAGHNPPVLIREKKATFVMQKANLVLAAMDATKYRKQTVKLQPGDILYLYTDGVTEAPDPDDKIFGNDRLLNILSDDFGSGEAACRKVCDTVLGRIDEFAKDVPQFDDITQLCIYYAGDSIQT